MVCKKKEKIVKIRLINVCIAIFIIGCTPPEEGASPDVVSNSEETNQECDLYLSFAITNFQNRDFQSTIENFKYVIDLGCEKRNARDIYQWLGRAYIELGKQDSASMAFKQGLKYLPDDDQLLQVAAWNAGKMNNFEEQLFYLDRLLSLDESNTDVLEELSDLYKDNEMYEEQINVLNIWLGIDSSNKKANAEKKAAYNVLGKDETDVDKERWEADPSNVQYGIDYAKGLKDAGNDEKVVSVCNELLMYEKYNVKVLRLLADAHLNLYNEDEALKTFENLSKVDPTDHAVCMEISEIYANKEDFASALDWAEKAISTSGGKGETYFQRAEVFFSIAETCSGETLTFWDKVVFEISWQDYNEAINKGYYRAKTRRDFLAENNITTTSDWFMRPDNEKEVSPQGDCYSIIDRKIKRK
jgi:tetratricopeptide (TPR) repeat protein